MNVDRNGTLNLLGALAQVYGEPTAGPTMARFPDSAPRFLYMSGISVTEASTFAWDRAKWQAEQAIQGSGLDWTIVRSSWLFGPDDVALNRLIGYSDYLPFVPLFGDGQAPLTPLYVEDLGRLFAAMMEGPEMSVDTLFKVGGPDEVTLNEFLHLAIRARGRRRPLLHIPMPVGKIQGAIMRHFPGRPLTPDAVDFVAQAGAVGADDRKFLAERFPTFAPTPLGSALGSYLGV
jgi:NADH dehydrogenase